MAVFASIILNAQMLGLSQLDFCGMKRSSLVLICYGRGLNEYRRAAEEKFRMKGMNMRRDVIAFGMIVRRHRK